MKRFKNILLTAGGEGWEKSSLQKAVTLAGNNHARLTVVDVLEELPRDLRILVTAIHLGDLQKLAVSERRKHLERLIAPFKRKGVRVTAGVLVGKPFLEIIRHVLRNKHDLVIKAAQEDAGLKTVVFGSTDMHLMRKCPCPVWIIRPGNRVKTGGIMAAVDPDPIDRKKNALNSKIMELAASLARMEEREFHAVHVWKLYTERMLVARGGLSHEEVEKLARTVRAERQGWLGKLVDTHAPGTPPGRVHLLKGEAEVLIPQAAKREQIDLIVMGTVSRTGMSGLLIGNTAEKILNRVDCSVLTVKPDGFVSPVKRK
jgi:nucleotide-binding universal stress UspA family protein